MQLPSRIRLSTLLLVMIVTALLFGLYAQKRRAGATAGRARRL